MLWLILLVPIFIQIVCQHNFPWYLSKSSVGGEMQQVHFDDGVWRKGGFCGGHDMIVLIVGKYTNNATEKGRKLVIFSLFL